MSKNGRLDRILNNKGFNNSDTSNNRYEILEDDYLNNIFEDNENADVKNIITKSKDNPMIENDENIIPSIEIFNHNKTTSDYDLINENTSTLSAKSIMDNYNNIRNIVLNKEDIDITREDLPYIQSRDLIYQKLPSRYKHIIQVRESIEFIYKKFGKEVESFLKDPSIIEVQLNQDGSVWIEQFGVGKFKTNVIIDIEQGNSIIKIIADYNKKVVTNQSSVISAVLPTGERFEGILGEPVGNNPIFAIRKKPNKIFTLDDYVNQGVITQNQRDIIRTQIFNKKNILIVGGTSSGKTTFTNACLDVLKETTDRVLIIEDTPELICNVDNKVELVSTQNTSMNDLLKSAMRLTPDRIVVGEMRNGNVAIELLKLWNSGHDGGFSTIHAGSCQSGLLKLEQYLKEVTKGSQVIPILEAVHVVITMVKENNKRVLKEIKKVVGYDKDKEIYILEDIT